MDIFLASNNRHKKEEFQLALPEFRIILPGDIGIEFDYQEEGSSFMENSLGKARYLNSITGKPVLADDSGICIDALGGRPGIFSARYGSLKGGQELPSEQRNSLLLKEMEGIEERCCRFVCSLSLVFDQWRFYQVQETLEGTLADSPRGDAGFGYDPLVWLSEYKKTVAELDPDVKSRISHRGKAIAALKLTLKTK